ncbi:MAG: DUF58 domain-containing protein [Candidatus Dormiibacterota bacterium]
MIRRPTPRLVGYASIVALGVYGAVALDRIAAVALVVPFALWLALGLASTGPPELKISSRLDQERIAEDDEVDFEVEVSCRGKLSWLELELELPEEVESDIPGARIRIRPRGDSPQTLTWRLRPRRWGAFRCGPIRVRGQDRLGLITYSARLDEPKRLRVYPSFARLRQLVPPARTQLFAGNRIARSHGEGIEFAGIRGFTAGDRVRRVNWRATARTGAPHVNDFHLERNSDVILFVDSFADLGVDQESVLTLAVRAATALADGYLGERDRVGVVGFGGLLRWLLPGLGPRHFYRVVESLLDTQVVTSYAWRAIDVIPPRVLPPSATVVALTPLLDARSLGALVDLHQRGFDLVVLEIDPERFLPRTGRRPDPVALRLWELLRVARRRSLQRAGLIVLEWPEEVALEALLAQVREYRRFARRSVA